jgi:hypothetical protein
MANSCIKIRHAKARGEWAELRFMARAAELGLRVTKPWGDNSPYDFAVDSRGRFFRVQVKCTCKRRANSWVCSVSCRRGPYSPAQIDFIAAVTCPERSMPCAEREGCEVEGSFPSTSGTSSRSPPSAAPSMSGSPPTVSTPATPNSKKPGTCSNADSDAYGGLDADRLVLPSRNQL